MSLTRPHTKQKYLITRGMSWLNPHKWKVLLMTSEPHLLTCQEHSQLSHCLTPAEAARIAFRLLPGAQVYMWEGDPNWKPSPGGQLRAARVVATVANGVWATDGSASKCAAIE